MANKRKNSPFGDIFDRARNSEDKKIQERLIKGETVNAGQYVVKEIPVEDIIFNRNNTIFNENDTEEDIKILAASMSEPRDLRNPILVKKMQNGKYLLIGGERRTRAFKLHGWRRIPAIVYDNMSDDDATTLLLCDNLQNRPLTDKQRFLAFDKLENHLRQMQEKVKVKELNDKIAEMLSVTERTVERLRRLRKHATEEDIELLRNGEITYDEFKSRTNQLIAEIERQQSVANQRKVVIAQSVTETRYTDQSRTTVYYINENKDGTYSIHMTNKNMKNVGLILLSCPKRKDKKLAQVDLDYHAERNGWTEYKGDMSEFEEKPVNDEKPITAAPTENSNTDGNTPLEPVSSKLGKDDVSDDTSDFPTEQESESESVGTTPAVETATTDTNHLENREINSQNDSHEDEHDNSIETDSALETEDRIEGQISDFVGINRSGQSIRGSLCTSNDKVFIIHNISFGDEIGDGKYNIRCIAEEVDKNTVQRYDI